VTPDGEVAIVPRAEYERLKALEQEAEEDVGTARLIARAKREVQKERRLKGRLVSR